MPKEIGLIQRGHRSLVTSTTITIKQHMAGAKVDPAGDRDLALSRQENMVRMSKGETMRQ